MASQAGTSSTKRRRSPGKPAPPAPASRAIEVTPARAAVLAACFAALVAAAPLLPGFTDVAMARWSCWGAAAFLVLWGLALPFLGRRFGGERSGTFAIEINLRPQHYVQACAHLTIYTYWAGYWQGVRDVAPLIAAQIAFAYGLDSLLSWSRRGRSTLGFGPFPIIFSTNLFLWFKPEWFYLQFLMVTVGFCAREFIRWNRDGRSVHIFNPSSLPLSLFSIGLILTQNTGLTFGQEIASTQLYPPHMYLVIFLVSLPGQLLFGVSSMTVTRIASLTILVLCAGGSASKAICGAAPATERWPTGG